MPHPPTKGDIFFGIAGSEELLSPFGRELMIGDNELSVVTRSLDGTMHKDIEATKVTITLTYSIITGTELKRFINWYRMHSIMSIIMLDDSFDYEIGSTMVYDDEDVLTYEEAIITYPELIGTGTNLQIYNVMMRPLERKRFRLHEDGLWSGVSVVLDEI